MKTKAIPFAELRQLLLGLGYREKHSDTAIVFHRGGEDRLIFRRYRDAEEVDQGDLLSTRRFLDYRGLLGAADFDAFLARATTSA